VRIGLLLPAAMAVDGRGNGIRAQAIHQMEALRRLGHDVVPMQPWEEYDSASFDVVHFFLGGPSVHGLVARRRVSLRMLSFAPIIDTNESFSRYRLAARLGESIPKVFTIPGMYREQALASDLVVCRSRHELDRMVKGLGIDRAKCRIVLNGVDPPPPADGDRARRKFGIEGDFLLHVGAFTQSRKNAVRLAEAAIEAKLPLVVAGRSDPGTIRRRLDELAERSGGRLRILEFLERQDLEDLYAACRVFCLPSVHEGTGLVALEAAAHGAGVVVTRHGGPPDYFGSDARYVDPADRADIARALREAWDDPRGESLRRHVASLTWDASARSLVEAFESRRPS